MPGPLALPSLEIHNFRGLRELKIARLGRVNLIVGKNNVGKTSVLEALRIYSNPALSGPILSTLLSHGEISRNYHAYGKGFGDFGPEPLFFSTSARPTSSPVIRIGPSGDTDREIHISQELGYSPAGPGLVAKYVLRPEGEQRQPGDELCLRFCVADEELLVPWLQVHNFMDSRYHDVIDWQKYLGKIYRKCAFLSSGGLESAHVARYWDKISLTPSEDVALAAIQIMAPEIERIVVKTFNEADLDREAFARTKGSAVPIPLRRFGEGVNRLFGLALLMVDVENGLMLVDEIENGLHYSIQRDVWRFVFQLAARLKIQVFATTHSSDCVEAFQAAASESEEDGILIRLARKGDRIVVGEYDEALLQKAVDGGVEVR